MNSKNFISQFDDQEKSNDLIIFLNMLFQLDIPTKLNDVILMRYKTVLEYSLCRLELTRFSNRTKTNSISIPPGRNIYYYYIKKCEYWPFGRYSPIYGEGGIVSIIC